jgi:hypothetical protein
MNRAFRSRVAFRPSLEPCPPASTRSLYGSLPRKKSCADPAAVGANTCRRVLRDWSTSLPTQKPIGSSGGPPIGWSRTKPPLPPPEPRLVRSGSWRSGRTASARSALSSVEWKRDDQPFARQNHDMAVSRLWRALVKAASKSADPSRSRTTCTLVVISPVVVGSIAR